MKSQPFVLVHASCVSVVLISISTKIETIQRDPKDPRGVHKDGMFLVFQRSAPSHNVMFYLHLLVGSVDINHLVVAMLLRRTVVR